MSLARRLGLCACAAVLLVAASAPDDPLVDQQWHLPHIGAFAAWEQGTGQDIVVAIVDTGVDHEHPDLQGQVGPGVDLVDRGTRPDDPNGHGTIVAGIVAAVAGNEAGGAGVAPQARIMPVRVLGADGEGSSRTVAEGIRWAARRGAHVINLSLADAPGQTRGMTDLITTDVELAIREATLQGAVVVVAAGNEGREETPYRGGLPALVVGASDQDDAPWRYSNYDSRTLFAPGVEIVSTYVHEQYVKADGTSFAAPVVAGAAAILVEQGLDGASVRDRLVGTAADIGAGAGRLDLAAAAGAPTPPASPQPGASPSPARSPQPPATPPSPVVEPIEEDAGPTTVPERDEDAAAVPEGDGGPVTIIEEPADGEQAAGTWDSPEGVHEPLPTWLVGLASALLALNLVGLASWAAYGRGQPAARASGR